MKKILSLSLLLAACLLAEDDARTRFLLTYYSGDYQKAHKMLQASVQDEVLRQVWDERIHAQEAIDGCKLHEGAPRSSRALALLRIGSIDRARQDFTDDWLSMVGKGTMAWWDNDSAAAITAANQALKLAPERPEVLYLAGNVTPDVQQSIDFFKKFLAVPSEDPIRKKVVENSIDFMEKTRDLRLNIVQFDSKFETLETNYNLQKSPIVKARINNKRDVSLLMDTGSGGLTLRDRDWSPKLATQVVMFGLGKKQTAPGERLVLDRFESGAFSVSNVMAASSNSLPFPDIDGVVGSILFSDFKLYVPLKSKKPVIVFRSESGDPQQFLQKQGIKLSGGVKVPFRLINKLILLKGRIRNSPEDMDIMLDTGASASVLSMSTAKHFTRINYPLSLELSDQPGVSGIGGTTSVLIAENAEIQIGSLKKGFNLMGAVNLADSSEGMDLEMDLILGQDFLADYNLLIDYAARTVTFYK